MKEVFLSAGVPNPNKAHYEGPHDPDVLETALRDLLTTVFERRDVRLVWGGQPEISALAADICDELGGSFNEQFVLYQSGYFVDVEPELNKRIPNIERPDAQFVNGVKDLGESLKYMRHEMMKRSELKLAIFMGGMGGIREEFHIYKEHHPYDRVLLLGCTGGATGKLAQDYGTDDNEWTEYGELFREAIDSVGLTDAGRE